MPGSSPNECVRLGRSGNLASFELFVVSLGGSWDPSLPIAGSRAGAVGLLDLCYLTDASHAQHAAARLASLSRGKFGLVLHARLGEVESAALNAVGSCDTVLLVPEPDADLAQAAAHCRDVASRIGLVCTCEHEAHWAAASGLDFLVAKGHEAGGRVGEETCFVLLQRLLARGGLPVYAWGGVGRHTAAGCRAAGASGVFLDWQLALTRESTVPASFQRRIAAMDGSETVVVPRAKGEMLRLYARPGMSAKDRLEALSHELQRGTASDPSEWNRAVGSLMATGRLEERLWPVGQDAALASTWSPGAPTVARALAVLRSHIDEQIAACRQARMLARGSPLALSHGTAYPLVQGPMARVSDVPEFCEAVASGGGLPSLALAMMRGQEVRPLLERTRDLLGTRPWCVGVLGFVDPELWAEQLEAIRDVPPPYAIIAGGRPDQAASLEAAGIHTYLHVPSPEMLRMFLREGARRLVFEGREAGGHVGPRTAFALWDSMIQVLLDAGLPDAEMARVHVLFAGGIHDALGASIVSAAAQPLIDRGAKVGVVLGSAYLFTEEVVRTGAVQSTFQDVVLDADGTVLLEAGPGHAIRCVETEYAHRFEATRLALQREARPANAIREALERMNLGRLWIAAKGQMRGMESASGGHQLAAVDEAEQRRSGIYMVGQVAGLRRKRCSIAALHKDVCDGAVDRLEALRLEPVGVVPPSESTAVPFDVAVVGMSCLLPGAPDLEAFWHNILSRHDAIGVIPTNRFDYKRWFDPGGGTGNKTCSKWGGFLDEIPFDPLKFGIPPTALKSIEPVQLLALEVAHRALGDAGYADDNPHRTRTSVILGVGGGMSDLGEKYAFRAMAPHFIDNPDESLWRQLPEWTEDSFPGILPNIVAGRIANRFDFGGVSYVVDAACASSLAAVYQACGELANGTSDMVITGGCETVQTPVGYVCFSNTGALSPRGCSRPFDADADGIAISEGLAMIVLKRREDAERDGDRIYAVIRAVAGGSDGRSKGLTAPDAEGQARVLERAYQQAGFSPDTLGLIEAHGTGTEVGDQTECRALRSVLANHEALPDTIALGSVKSMIGHTKCAAGVAGLIKAALALYHRTLPPTIHVETPNPKAELDDGPLYVSREPRPWIRGRHPRRVGVSAFGFGGSNFHAVLEEYQDEVRTRHLETPRRQRPAELFVFSGRSREELIERVRTFDETVDRLARSGRQVALCDVAFTLHCRGCAHPGVHRATLVASNVSELSERLGDLIETLVQRSGTGARPPAGMNYSDSSRSRVGEVAFLFPGQGAQSPGMMGDLTIEFSEVRARFECADRVVSDALDRPLSRYILPPPAFTDDHRSLAIDGLKATNVAQPALGVCDLAMLRLLDAFGVRPTMTAGHSYGELVALYAGGSIDEPGLYHLSSARGEAMVATKRDRADADLGQMLAVGADEAAVRDTIRDCESVWLANLNSPSQTIISGTVPGLAKARELLEDAGLACTPVPVACAFHSPMMAPARERFAEVLSKVDFAPPRLPVFSNVTAGTYPPEAEGIRHLLTEQLTNQVRFAEQVEAMYAAGARVFVEVGPRRILSRLVDQILCDKPHMAVATQPGKENGITELLHALAALFAQGVDVDLNRLYEGRSVTVLDLDAAGAKPQSGYGPNIWLVDGGHARPASEPRPTPRERAVIKRSEAESPAPAVLSPKPETPRDTEHPSEAASTSPTPLAGSQSTEDIEAMAEFQETMRQFLKTQQAVMEAFCATGAVPALPTHEEAEPTETVEPEPPGRTTARAAAQAPPPAEEPARDEQVAADDDGQGAASLDSRLRTIVSDRTGYPPEMLDLDANLEADLGIDSIKRVEIIGAFRRSIFPTMEEPPSWFMERMAEATTMHEICAGVAELRDRELGRPSEPTEAASSTSADGAGPSTAPGDVPPNPSGRVPAGSGPPADTRGHAPALACPRCVAKVVACPLPEEGDIQVPDGVVVVTKDGHGLAKSLVRSIESRGGRAVMIDCDDLQDRAAAESLLENIRREHGAIQALVHLRPLNDAPPFPGVSKGEWTSCVRTELKSLLYLLQAMARELNASRDRAVTVLSATRGGGDFAETGDQEAVHPWRGGLAGLLKTASREWEQVRFRALDSSNVPEASLLLRELSADGPVEIGYRDGRRLATVAVREELPVLEPPYQAGLGEQDVVLVTGGARGITAQIAHEIALQTKAALVLLGRSPLPDGKEEDDLAAIHDPVELRKAVIARIRRDDGDSVSPKVVESRLGRLLRAREIRRTLAALEEAGARVEYRCCDVRDRAALTAVIEDIQRRHGGIDAIIHGAGIIEDRYIVDKDSASFDRVVGTKVDPVLTFADALTPPRLKLVMLFSSVAGFYGNPGQGDYAAANEIVNRVARRLRSVWPTKVVAMNWGPWHGVGMVTPEVARQFETRGVGMVTVPAGRQATWREIVHRGTMDVRVIVGPGPWIDGPDPVDQDGATDLASTSR